MTGAWILGDLVVVTLLATVLVTGTTRMQLGPIVWIFERGHGLHLGDLILVAVMLLPLFLLLRRLVHDLAQW